MQPPCKNIIKINLPIVQFNRSDKEHVIKPQYDSIMIYMLVENCLIKRIIVNNKSVMNIMMLETLKQIYLKEEDMINELKIHVSFSGEIKQIIWTSLPT